MEEGLGRSPPQKGESAREVTFFVDLTTKVGRISVLEVYERQ